MMKMAQSLVLLLTQTLFFDATENYYALLFALFCISIQTIIVQQWGAFVFWFNIRVGRFISVNLLPG
jgi:hypothetical protein